MKEELSNGNVIVSTIMCDMFTFKSENVRGQKIDEARRDAGRFFCLANVEMRGDGLFPVFALKGKQKIGIFAESMLESAENILKAYQHAPLNIADGMGNVIPALDVVKTFDKLAQPAMLSLLFMGHHVETIAYLFLHMHDRVEWP